MSTIDEKIQRLEEKLKQEKAKKARIEARKRAAEQSKNRQEDTRRKVLLGAFVMDCFEGQPETLTMGQTNFADWLKRDSDRALFGLPQTPPPGPPTRDR